MERYITKIPKVERCTKAGFMHTPPITPNTSDATQNHTLITKNLLKTLSEPSNPITHSDIYQRTDHIVSTATGHQVSDKPRNRRSYLVDRAHKLVTQQTDEKTATNRIRALRSVKVYINGYLRGTTDTEVKRLVVEAGGQIASTVTCCTHIISSQHLNGSKTQKFITAKKRQKPYIVRPEWIIDSVTAGKRLSEQSYILSAREGEGSSTICFI